MDSLLKIAGGVGLIIFPDPATTVVGTGLLIDGVADILSDL